MLEGIEAEQQENALITQTKALKEDLQRRIRKECSEFELRTGLTIRSLDIHRTRIQTLLANERSVLESVTARIEI